MTLSRDSSLIVVERARREPQFAAGLFQSALQMIVDGESATALVLLRDLVNASIGFEELARRCNIPPKSLHRMLSADGNPYVSNFAAVCSSLRESLNLVVVIHATCADTPPVPQRTNKTNDSVPETYKEKVRV